MPMLGINLGISKHKSYNKNLYTWVSTDGNDTTGTGTFENPYKTLMKVESLTLIGTKANIYVMPGTYKETHVFNKAYTWIAYGSVTLQSAVTSGVVVFGDTCDGAYIKGFTIDREGTNSTICIFNANAVNSTLDSCTLINPHSTKNMVSFVATTAETNCSVINCTLTGTATRCFSLAPGKNRYITNNTISGTYTYIFNAENVANDNETNYVISNNTISWTAGRMFYWYCRNANIEFKYNTVTAGANSTADYMLTTYTALSFIGKMNWHHNNFTFANYRWNTTNSLIYLTGATNDVEFYFEDNILTTTANNNLRPVIWSKDLKSVKYNRNQITNIGMTSSEASTCAFMVTCPTKANTGVYEINNNTIRYNNGGGYVICVGTDQTGTGDGNISLVTVNGNLIYGNRYYDNASTGITHAILCGFFTDYEVKYNTLIGCGYGIVAKHDNAHALTGNGLSYNIIIDANNAMHIKGINDMVIYNNTIINMLAQISNQIIIVANPDHAGTCSCKSIYNNILYAKIPNSKALIKLDTDSELEDSDFNIVYTTGQDIIATVLGSNKTYAEWVALGYSQNGLNAIPELINLISMDSFNPRPIPGSNVIGVAKNLGISDDDGIDIDSIPPSITTITQPASPTGWSMGAYIRDFLTFVLLNCTNIASDSCKVNWELSDNYPSSGLVKVEVATDSDFEDIVFTDTSAQDSLWTIAYPLEPETLYYVRMYAVDIPSTSNVIQVTTSKA